VFALQYDTEQRLSAITELSWNTKPLTLNLTGKYHSYTLCSGDPAWFKPNIEALFTARYQWRERIIASAVIEYRGEVFAGVPPLQQVPIDEKIKGFTDIGLTLEYRFASWFGLYVEAKNVLNVEKQYYLFYNEPGIRLGGGMTFRF